MIKIKFWNRANDRLINIQCEVCVFGGGECPPEAKEKCKDGGVWTTAQPLKWDDVINEGDWDEWP